MARFSRRLWGWYYTIIDRPYFKLKILRFLPNRSCSLQYHKHRKELWLLFKGWGYFTKGNQVVEIFKSGSYMEVKEWETHRFEAKEKCWVLEVQYGEKCEEGDIVRV